VAEGERLDDLEAKNWSPDSSQIAFRNGFRLLAARADGKDTLELSNETVVLSWQWASTGAHLIYDAGLSLRLASLDGTASQDLGRPRDNNWPAHDGWSSDGLRFAYVSHTDGGIWVRDVHGGARAVGHAETSQAFAWSPDGSRLAHSTANGVAITLADGSRVFELSNEPVTPGLGHFYSWAPDGSRLAYRVGVNLWTALPDGSDRRPVESSAGISTIYWAPDSSRLAFIVSTDSPGVLWMASKTGADARPLSPDPVVLACVWAPDATRIGCLEQPNPSEQRVRIAPADGSGNIVLPVTSPLMGIQWSPTSEVVAVSRGDNALASNSPVNSRMSLFAADGTSEIPLNDQARGSGLWSSDGNWYVHTDGTALHATNLRGERRLLGGTASQPLRRFEVR
jgi:Tol biopolymer transport system component